MKRNLLLLALLTTACLHSTHTIAQRHGIGLHFGAYDFFGPQTGDYIRSDRFTYEYNEGRKLYDTAHHKKFYWKPMVKLTYWWQATRNFDVNLGLSLANLEYPRSSDDTNYVRRNRYNTSGE